MVGADSSYEFRPFSPELYAPFLGPFLFFITLTFETVVGTNVLRVCGCHLLMCNQGCNFVFTVQSFHSGNSGEDEMRMSLRKYRFSRSDLGFKDGLKV